MPTYEYECKSCGHTFEAFQAMSDEPLKECPQCGKEIRRLIFGGTGVIFKGSGFYVTDKGKNSGAAAAAKPAKTPESSSSVESAPKTGEAAKSSASEGGVSERPAKLPAEHPAKLPAEHPAKLPAESKGKAKTPQSA
jgi:putative FmdB family regulatory protein